jgi:hypothetical protein
MTNHQNFSINMLHWIGIYRGFLQSISFFEDTTFHHWDTVSTVCTYGALKILTRNWKLV